MPGSQISSPSEIDKDEPKYKISVRFGWGGVKIPVSSSQVQFWPEYVKAYMAAQGGYDDILNDKSVILDHEEVLFDLSDLAKATINTHGPNRVLRVDLMTNSYYSDHVMRLDNKTHGPLFEKTLEAIENND